MSPEIQSQPGPPPTFPQRARQIMMVVVGVVVAALFGLVITLMVLSPGTPVPVLDAAGRVVVNSISEKLSIDINGVPQGMFIVGKDRTKPVLLFLHGGPGMPEYAISRTYPTVLEDLFVVCWWEMRGSGLSYRADEDVTFEQLISDTIAVSNYLRTRFGQDKIYLMAHSGGSFVGIQAAARAPQLYKSYIGMAQISQQMQSEKLAYSFMREQFVAAGNEKMLATLDRTPLLGLQTMPEAYKGVRDEAMHSLGIGTTHAMRSVVTGIFLPVMLSPVYTLAEKLNFWRAKWSANTTRLWNEILATDLTVRVPRMRIPAYFLSGSYDYTVSQTLARAYYDKLEAPLKGFYTFAESAHSPLFEEPERMRRILAEDVLKGVVGLADGQLPP